MNKHCLMFLMVSSIISVCAMDELPKKVTDQELEIRLNAAHARLSGMWEHYHTLAARLKGMCTRGQQSRTIDELRLLREAAVKTSRTCHIYAQRLSAAMMIAEHLDALVLSIDALLRMPLYPEVLV